MMKRLIRECTMSKFKKGKERQVTNITESVSTERPATAQTTEETETVATQVANAAEVQTETENAPEQPVSERTAESILAAETVEDAVAAFAGGTPPETEDEPPAQSPIEEARSVESHVVEEVRESQVPADVVDAAKAIPLSAAMQKIHELEAKILALSATKGTRRVASGSKARPNVKYTLLSKPPKWDGAPQVAQLMQILYDPKFVEAHKLPDGTVEIPEPELFAQIERGAAAGVLRTKQLPVRIFQYYRNDLLQAHCLLWK